MKYRAGQQIPLAINSMFEQGRIVNTVVTIRKIVGDTIFIHIPMEYGTYLNLYGTEEQLNNLLVNRCYIGLEEK